MLETFLKTQLEFLQTQLLPGMNLDGAFKELDGEELDGLLHQFKNFKVAFATERTTHDQVPRRPDTPQSAYSSLLTCAR